jgi:hypothetical protein
MLCSGKGDEIRRRRSYTGNRFAVLTPEKDEAGDGQKCLTVSGGSICDNALPGMSFLSQILHFWLDKRISSLIVLFQLYSL